MRQVLPVDATIEADGYGFLTRVARSLCYEGHRCWVLGLLVEEKYRMKPTFNPNAGLSHSWCLIPDQYVALP